MKIEEAIKRVEQMGEYERFVDEPVSKKSVLDIISKIDEPQKPVVPKFVAEWIEEAKEGECSLCTAFGLVDGDNRNFDWLFNGDKSNQDTFARAWLDGYTVEKEKLYTVEIPNPKVCEDGFLTRLERKDNAIQLSIRCKNTVNTERFKLTEKKIKKDFDWAWQFAKEVTE